MPFVCLSVYLSFSLFVFLFVRNSNDTRWNDRANNFPMVSTHTRVLGDCQLLIRYFPFSVQTSHYWCTILKSETPERFENYLTSLSSKPHPCQENIVKNYMQSGRVQKIRRYLVCFVNSNRVKCVDISCQTQLLKTASDLPKHPFFA